MKLVRENIEFERGIDPKASIGIGMKNRIEEWLKEHRIYTYHINPDFTINAGDPVQLIEELEGNLPDYIQFNVVNEEFDVDDCGMTSLKGSPKVVHGYFSCQMNELTSLEEGPNEVFGDYFCYNNPGNFTEEYVKSICKVHGKIGAEDTPEW